MLTIIKNNKPITIDDIQNKIIEPSHTAAYYFATSPEETERIFTMVRKNPHAPKVVVIDINKTGDTSAIGFIIQNLPIDIFAITSHPETITPYIKEIEFTEVEM